MFGVGGGIVQGPVMLEMGVLPEVAAGESHHSNQSLTESLTTESLTTESLTEMKVSLRARAVQRPLHS